MEIHGGLSTFIDVHGDTWRSNNVQRGPGKPMEIYGDTWTFMDGLSMSALVDIAWSFHGGLMYVH